MTKHEFCEHLYCTECDSVLAGYEPCYHEDKEAYESELKRQGAVDALEELRHCISAWLCEQEVTGDEFWGYKSVANAIDRRLSDLEPAMEGGAL